VSILSFCVLILLITIDSETNFNSKEVKLLGVTLDSKLSFYSNISNICMKASGKIEALMRIRGFLTPQ